MSENHFNYKGGWNMKAILTKCLPATNTKPTRIKAYTEGGNQVTLSWSTCEDMAKDISGGQVHLSAAQALCRKMGWSENIIGGGAPNGYVFVFKESYIQ